MTGYNNAIKRGVTIYEMSRTVSSIPKNSPRSTPETQKIIETKQTKVLHFP